MGSQDYLAYPIGLGKLPHIDHLNLVLEGQDWVTFNCRWWVRQPDHLRMCPDWSHWCDWTLTSRPGSVPTYLHDSDLKARRGGDVIGGDKQWSE